jgi:putative salt-induced outer membrane protein YdiY
MLDPALRAGPVAVLLVTAIGSVPSQHASAQEPAAPATDSMPDRWDGSFDLGLNGATGNTSLAVVTTSIRIKHLETRRYELEWSVSFRYGESDGKVVARTIRSGLAYDLYPEATWSPFVFVDAERDAFRKLDLRTNAGAGVKRTLVNMEVASFSLSAAVLHDYENFAQTAGDEPLASRNNARWSLRAKGHRVLARGIRFEHVTFFQPVWDDARDYNIDTNTKATVLLTERVGVNIGYNFRRDSTPPPDVVRNDQIIQVGVTVQL